MYQALPIGVEVGLLVEGLVAALDPNQNYYTTGDIIDALPKSKLHYLGSGAFGVASSAYLSDGREVVIKLAGMDADGYPWWAEYCKANPAPHLPEVYYTAQVGPLHITAMKRYEPLSDDLEDVVRSSRDGSICGNYVQSLAEAIINVRDLIEQHRGGVDMHLGNYMYDPEKDEIVITDPCSYMRSSDDPIYAPVQLAMNFEIDNMGTAIDSLLSALRKADELHGKDRDDHVDARPGKVLLPKDNNLFAMDLAKAEERMVMAYGGARKPDDEIVKFMQQKWGVIL